MAQVLAEPRDVRHGFSYIGEFNHDFGQITGITATIKGNILLCDYFKKELILIAPLGNYLQSLDVDSEPYDVAITSKNVAYITQPNSNSVLQIDPDRIIVLNKATCSDLDTNVFCVSAAQNTEEKVSCFLGMNTRHVDIRSYAVSVIYNDILGNISKRITSIGARVVKFHEVNEKTFFIVLAVKIISCIPSLAEILGISKIFLISTPWIYQLTHTLTTMAHLCQSTWIEQHSQTNRSMAQVLAVPGDVRHGFSNAGQFHYDFGRITGIAATIKGNILLCDYDKKNLILVYPLGNHLKKLDLDGEPYDIAITGHNIGYITLPNSRSVLQIDPDRMLVLFKATCNELSTNVFCVSAFSTARHLSKIAPCLLGIKIYGFTYGVAVNHDQINLTDVPKNGSEIGSCVVRFHVLDDLSCLSCIGGQNYIAFKDRLGNQDKIYDIATMDTPTDICSDNKAHIYVSGHGSNNIHRLTWSMHMSKVFRRMESDFKVLDIPLDSRHGIKEPVVMCFNKDYSKLYVVNDWGKSVLIFDVI